MSDKKEKTSDAIEPKVRKAESKARDPEEASAEAEAVDPMGAPPNEPDASGPPRQVDEEEPKAEQARSGPRRRVVDIKRDDETTSEAAQRIGRKVEVARSAPVGPRPEKKESEESKKPVASGDEPRISVDEQASLSDFEAMLAGESVIPEQVELSVGDKVEGRVDSIGDRWIYVSLGGATEGIARKTDFLEDGELTIAEGQTHPFYVVSTAEGTILLGDQLQTREATLEAVETAHETGVPVEGRVASRNKGGFEIEINGVRAFCPISQIELAYTEEPDIHIGNTYRFKVTEIREGGRSIVVSRAEVLREEADVAAQRLMETLEEGAVLQGKITRVVDFGAFVDIGGVEGLVHVSQLGFSHVEHPSEVVREGDLVDVKVLSIEQSERGPRISLSMKETMKDPWETAQAELHPGKQVEGTAVRVESFGVFVEVLPGVEGLVHVSEMSWEHVKRPSDLVSVGNRLTVEVLDVDLARRRISLSMKSAKGDPWDRVVQDYPVGAQVQGTVENVEDFGAFIGLEGGITALLPRSEMELSREAAPHTKYRQGDTVTARVLSVEPQRRRMALTTKSADEIEEQAQPTARSYEDKSSGGGGSFGTLGDLLKDKFGK